MDSYERALLLTDVVDSTRLTGELSPGELLRVWSAHDAAARNLVRQWRGREINRSDGMLMMFERVDDAAGFAQAYHGALAALQPPFKARVAVHVGEVLVQENAPLEVAYGAKAQEVFGHAISVVARVMPLAHPAQTLVTGPAAQGLSPAWLRRSQGAWRMKGIDEPIELIAIAADPAGIGAPPQDSAKVYRVVQHGDTWLPAHETPGWLPAPRDAFIGRRAALVAVEQRIDEGARLVTLTGLGGIGKTRLALEYARRWRGDFPGGTWFCDLTAATGRDSIIGVVAQALGATLGDGEPAAQVGALLAQRSTCLLVLDNFEQVAEHASTTVGLWLDAAASATFLVTSREALGLPGEHLLPLDPLSGAESAELFGLRAAAEGRELTPGELATDVQELARVLEGIPLALEIAASRALVMSPHMLLQRIGRRFELLVNARGRAPRQASLQATLDWSWELLSTEERETLAQLSVFQGSFGLPGVEAVIRHAHPGGCWTGDLLQALVQKSLVRRASEERFELLVSVREYASGKLNETGRAEAQMRHGRFCAGLGEVELFAHRGAELDNVLCAFARARERRDDTLAAQLLEVAAFAILSRGPFSRAIELAGTLQQLPAIADGPLARAALVAGRGLALAGRAEEAVAAFERALALARQAQDPRTECWALNQLAISRFEAGAMAVAADLNGAAVALLPRVGEPWLATRVSNAQGTIAYSQGRLVPARKHFGDALRALGPMGSAAMRSVLLNNLGCIAGDLGQLPESRAYQLDAIAAAAGGGHRVHEVCAMISLAEVELLCGNIPDVMAGLEQALVLARTLESPYYQSLAQRGLGAAWLAQGDYERARDAHEAGLQLAQDAGDLLAQASSRLGLARVAAASGDRNKAHALLDSAETALRGMDNQLQLALMLAIRAELAHGAADHEREREAAAEARAICSEGGLLPTAEPLLILRRIEQEPPATGLASLGAGSPAAAATSSDPAAP